MSGYLRNLAAHAAMPGPRLRPLATPFAASLIAPASPLELDAENVTPPATLRQSAVATPEAIQAHDPAPRASLTLPEAIIRLTDGPVLSRTTPAAAANSQSGVDTPTTEQERASGDASVTDPLRLNSSRLAPPANRDRSAASHGRGRVEPRSVKKPRVPSVSQAPAAERRVEAFRGREESPPDVHIHIGRIELTAVTAPPPRRPAPTTKPAMQLDEYLRRRDETTR